MPGEAVPFEVAHRGVTLSGEESGKGPPVVLLHGLTATRRYVVMGSSMLQRGGHRVISYDARGHGDSSAAPERAYGYEHLAGDLLAVLEDRGIQRALLAGASMGAHTAMRLALEHPDRVAALALITPSFDPALERGEQELARWDALAAGLRGGGVEGFIAAYELEEVPEAWRETVERVLRQRLSAHADPQAVADALEVVPRSSPLQSLEALREISAPTLIVASRDEADPGHPLQVGEHYARLIPGAELIVEEEGPPRRSPIAWQGGQLSRAIAALAERAGQ